MKNKQTWLIYCLLLIFLPCSFWGCKNEQQEKQRREVVVGNQQELDVSRKEQLTSNWCWAACAQMLIKFIRDNGLSQEQIVAVMYDVPLSQVSIDNPDCNKPASIHEIETVFDEFAVRYEFRDATLTFQELKDELDIAPLELGILWPDGSMHAVVAYGYNTNGASIQEVLIRDPSPSTAPTVTVSFEDLITGAYGGRAKGKWVDTFWKFR